MAVLFAFTGKFTALHYVSLLFDSVAVRPYEHLFQSVIVSVFLLLVKGLEQRKELAAQRGVRIVVIKYNFISIHA